MKSDNKKTKASKTSLAYLGDLYKAESKTKKATVKSSMPSMPKLDTLEISGGFLFIVLLGSCFAYYMTFRSYHAELEKLEKMNDVYNNPNARVASKDEGERILKKIQSAKKT